jgi:hypothetical protein
MTIDQVLIIYTALISIVIGYYLGEHQDDKKKEIKSVFCQQPNRPLPVVKKKKIQGAIDYPSQEDLDYVDSEEEAADIARQDLFQKVFKTKP